MAEGVGRQFDIGRQARAYFFQSRFQTGGELAGAGVGLFGHCDQYGGMATFGGHTGEGTMIANGHVCYLGQCHGTAVGIREHHT